MRHYVYLNESKLRDAVVEAYFEQKRGGMSFSEFIKHTIYEHAQHQLTKRQFNHLVNQVALEQIDQQPSITIDKHQAVKTKQDITENNISEMLDDFGGI